MTIVIIAILVFVATLLGGFFALKFKDKLHLIVGFSAGAVLGIAFIDLLPEASVLTGNPALSAKIALGAILFYMVFDRLFLGHQHSQDNENTHDHVHDHKHENISDGKILFENKIIVEHHGRGIIRAGSLVLHSFLDGLAVGFSFQVSVATGVVVAVAVLAHDFSDGINTVAAILKGGDNKRAKIWLLADAVAPVIGIFVGSFFVVKEYSLGIILSVFSGFFIYIALADMIPESFHAHPKKWTTAMTVFGVLFIYLVISFIGF